MDYTKPMKREAYFSLITINGGIQFCSPYAGRVALSFRTPAQKSFGLLRGPTLPVFLYFHA
jgi:hypothetical protein